MADWGQHWGGGATAQWEGQPRSGGGNCSVGGAIGGSTVGVSSTSKNRPSHHNYKYESPKQFELKQLKGSKST